MLCSVFLTILKANFLFLHDCTRFLCVLVSATILRMSAAHSAVLPGFSDDLSLCTFVMRARLVSEEVTRGPSSHLRRGQFAE